MKRIMLNYFAAFFLLFSQTTLADKMNPDVAAVQKAYQSWCQSIGTAKGDPAVVVKYYAPDAVLVPTLAHVILVNKNGGLNKYFKKLTSYPNISCTTKKLHTSAHKTTIINSGFYDFSYAGDNGKTITIPSRFTFIYKKFGNDWLIVNHHSSKAPPE